MNGLTRILIDDHQIEPGWRFARSFRTRWSDLDGYAHVSHRAHFLWFEDARNAYLEQAGFPLVDVDVPGPVMKEASCRYEKVLAFGDQIVVTARTNWFGTTSFEMEYAMWNKGLIARGTALIVWFSNRNAEKVPLPGALREAMRSDGAVHRQSPPSPRINAPSRPGAP